MSKVRKCICCGKSYEYCPTCSRDPLWKSLYDSENCKEIVNIVSAYNMKRIDKAKAIERLKAVKISDVNVYNDDISKVLTELNTPKPKRRRKKK